MPIIFRISSYCLVLFGMVACNISKNNETENEATESDGMEKAMQHEFKMTRDPRLNYIPNERLADARAYMESLNSTGATARTAALGWQERGPNNVGGRTRAMLIDKRDASNNTVFAGSVSGGLFKTTNFTTPTPTWTPVNDFFPNLAVTAMVQDPFHRDTMYAGTGEGWFNIDAVRGGGIFRSTDGGNTWALLPSTSTFEYIQDLAVDNNSNLYASLRNLQSANRGVNRSTDAGGTWTQVLGAPLINPSTGLAFATGRAADLEVASNGDIYASLGLVGEAVTNRSIVMKSSFATHGANTGALNNWIEITPPPVTVTQRTEILVAPSDPNRVYLLMQDSATQQVLNVFRSNNAGSSWVALGAPSALNNGANSQTWYNLIGVVDPNNADVLTVGGLHLARSIDGAGSWATISSSPSVHVDQHFLQYIGSTKLVVGNDGGAYYTENIDAAVPTFVNKNNAYNVTQYYGCDYHPSNANYFLAGSQDNGTQKFTTPGINTTSNVVGGDGGFCHIDQNDGMIQIASTAYNNYFRSLNGGATVPFTYLSSVSNDRGQFINPTDYEDNANTLYCGDDPGKYFYISGLGATTPAGISVNVAIMGSREVTAVKVDPFTTNTIWLGASFNGLPQVLKLSSANTSTPTVVVSATLGSISGAAISSIDIDPANANHIVATLSNYGVPSVWESTDGGNSFSNIEGNLPDMPIRWVLFAPANAQLNGASGGNGGVLLGTELGVWTTSQIAGTGTQWIANNQGLANVRTDMLQYRASDNLVVAATHGRGLFTTILPTTVTGLPNEPATKNFIKYINAENNRLLIVTGTLQTKTMTIQLLNMQGQLVYQSNDRYQNKTIDIGKLQSGVYIVKITGDKREHFVQQMVKK